MYVCYKGPILSFKALGIHPVLLADEFTSSKNTYNATFAKTFLKYKLFIASYCRYLVSDYHFLFFLNYLPPWKELKVCFGDNSNHSNIAKTKENRTCKSNYVRLPIGTMYNSNLFISKLSSVTVGFLVRNGFSVS